MSPVARRSTNDQHHAGDKSIKLITVVTIGVIFLMLLFVYRSIVTVLLVLGMMFIELSAARGIVAALGYYNFIGLSTFAVNLLTTLAIAAGTDYAIFLVGRYHEARQAGEDRETAFYTMYHGTAHVILGSGLTIAGATFCLHFTRLPYFQTLGIPLAIGMLVAVAAALTMAPALLTICSRFGLFDPKRTTQVRAAGAASVRRGAVAGPDPRRVGGARARSACWRCRPTSPSYNDRKLPAAGHPGQCGLRGRRPALPAGPDEPGDAAGRDRPRCAQLGGHAGHRSNRQRQSPTFPGIGRVQAITRPQGTPIEHTSIPFLISMQGTTQQMNQDYMQNVMANMLKQVDDMQTTINTMTRCQSLTAQMAATTHAMVREVEGHRRRHQRTARPHR